MSEDEELQRALQARPRPSFARALKRPALPAQPALPALPPILCTHLERLHRLHSRERLGPADHPAVCAALQESLNVSGGGQDMDEESALRWAQQESLKASKDASLPDLMLESELHRATQLSLRQSELETERLRQQEVANQAELAKGVQASLQATTPPRPAPPPAPPEGQQEPRTIGEPEYRANYS